MCDCGLIITIRSTHAQFAVFDMFAQSFISYELVDGHFQSNQFTHSFAFAKIDTQQPRDGNQDLAENIL